MARLFLISTFISVLMSAQPVYAQDNTNNSLYLEIGGVGYYASLNYEYSIFSNDLITISPRIGFSSYRITDFNGNFNPQMTVPLGVHFKTNKALYADLGLGTVIVSSVHSRSGKTKRVTVLGGFASIGGGYRFKNNVFCRLSYTPLYMSYQRFVHWGSISIGYLF